MTEDEAAALFTPDVLNLWQSMLCAGYALIVRPDATSPKYWSGKLNGKRFVVTIVAETPAGVVMRAAQRVIEAMP